jgi:hypothetical protein
MTRSPAGTPREPWWTTAWCPRQALLNATLATGDCAIRLANARKGLVLMYFRFGEQPGDGVVSLSIRHHLNI